MPTLVTGSAGFIGFHTARALLERGDKVLGIDDLNSYYSVDLKRARLAVLQRYSHFEFMELDLSRPDALRDGLGGARVRRVVHLAAQAGVRHSLEDPQAYIAANVSGHLNVLEYCRHHPEIEVLVYASSSSVYGNSGRRQLTEHETVDRPVSLYAATKRADELISHAYADLFGFPQIGLRFFTVYGPWGRPDMAVWSFTEAVLKDRPLQLFNGGRVSRDFTFIDDAVAAVMAALDAPAGWHNAGMLHRVYNVANGNPMSVIELVRLIEDAVGKKARIVSAPMQPGDVEHTAADLSLARSELGYCPETPLEIGIPRFVEWCRGRREAWSPMPRMAAVH